MYRHLHDDKTDAVAGTTATGRSGSAVQRKLRRTGRSYLTRLGRFAGTSRRSFAADRWRLAFALLDRSERSEETGPFGHATTRFPATGVVALSLVVSKVTHGSTVRRHHREWLGTGGRPRSRPSCGGTATPQLWPKHATRPRLGLEGQDQRRETFASINEAVAEDRCGLSDPSFLKPRDSGHSQNLGDCNRAVVLQDVQPEDADSLKRWTDGDYVPARQEIGVGCQNDRALAPAE